MAGQCVVRLRWTWKVVRYIVDQVVRLMGFDGNCSWETCCLNLGVVSVWTLHATPPGMLTCLILLILNDTRDHHLSRPFREIQVKRGKVSGLPWV